MQPKPGSLSEENESVSLLTDVQVAHQLAISVSSLRRWRAAGTGPSFVRVGLFLIRYRQADIAEWLNSGRTKDGRKDPA
jgi:predicted DNA-binding transcriptional regulator AlpA